MNAKNRVSQRPIVDSVDLDPSILDLHASSSASARTTCPVVRNGSDILNPTYPETCSGQHAYGCLRAWAGRSRPVAARRSHSNVESTDPSVLRGPRGSRRRLHRRVRRALKSVSFHMLTARTSGDGLSAGKVSYVDDCVVE